LSERVGEALSVTWESAARGGVDAGSAAAGKPKSPRQGVGQGAGAVYDQDALCSFFTLTAEDLALVRTARSARNQLGLALLLAWTRAERRAVSDPSSLPADVIGFVARQLDVSVEALAGYGGRPATRSAHVASVCRHLGLRSLAAADELRLQSFLVPRVAQTANLAALMEAADDWLFSNGLLRPAYDRVERLVRHVRAEGEAQLFAQVSGQLSVEQSVCLDALWQTGEGDSALAILRTPPRAPSAGSIRMECQRLASIREALVDIDWGLITPSRRRHWAGVVRRLYARDLGRYPSAKRLTLILAFLNVRAEEVTDAIVDMFDALVAGVVSRADGELTARKAAQVDAYGDNARLFRAVAEVILDVSIPAEAVRDAVFRCVPREELGRLVDTSKALDSGVTESLVDLLKDRFPYIRTFVPDVLATLCFAAVRDDDQLVAGIETLRVMNTGRSRKVPEEAPVGFVPRRWANVVTGPAGVDRRAWELALVTELRSALRAGDLVVECSRRYTRWDDGLYSPDAWSHRRGSWFAERGLPGDGAAFMAGLKDAVHEITVAVADRLPANTEARVEGGKLALKPLEAVVVPASAQEVRQCLVGMLPLVSLPELLLEVDRWTSFSKDLLHLTARGDASPRHVAATRPALFAVLVAEATNIGLATMSRASGIPHGQLVRVHDWCFRDETLHQAITTLVRYHQALPLTASFGPGTTSSSDGTRYGVSASVLGARHLPRYFGVRRGLSVYSHVSDQGPQFALAVINCQLREATFALDGVVHQDLYRIDEHYTDTHGYTDLIFGLCEVLGVRFAPRLRDLPDQVIYRAKNGVDYRALAPVLRRTVRDGLIIDHWDDINRVAASMHDGLVAPSLVVAKLQSLRRQNPLQQALQELGRLPKTRHILSYVDDPVLRRRVLVGLNKQERVHSMARAVCFGRQGRFPDRDAQAQLSRASALSLVLNAIIVFNTRYLGAASEQLASSGRGVPPEVWPHLSPLHWEHVHLVGTYRFDEPAIDGELRPFRGQN
jgi:TnpA family transposase